MELDIALALPVLLRQAPPSVASCSPSSETVNAKLRIFRAPEFLGTAFMLAVLAMLVHFLLESEMGLHAPAIGSDHHGSPPPRTPLISFVMLSQRRIFDLIDFFRSAEGCLDPVDAFVGAACRG